MPNNKVQRRTLSKVEQVILKEKEEDTKRIKEQKRTAWLKRQSEYNKQKKTNYVSVNQTSNQYNISKKQQPVKAISKNVVNIITIKRPSTPTPTYNWKCLNNSWADQSEFEDIRKLMLLRIAYKMMKC